MDSARCRGMSGAHNWSAACCPIVADDNGDPEELLKKLAEAEKEPAELRDQLKAILAEALLR